MTEKNPTPQAISRLLASRGFTRSAALSQSSWNQRCTEGFRVRLESGRVYVRWHPQAPLASPPNSTRRDWEMAAVWAERYAVVLREAGWRTRADKLGVYVLPNEAAEAAVTEAGNG